MPVSFVLKLVSDALCQRRIVGRIESVESGEQASVRNADELIGFLHAHATRPGPSHRSWDDAADDGDESAS